jgi:hypothetical protein
MANADHADPPNVAPGAVLPQPPPQPESGFPRERRFIFVQLLFSLTAAEIARQSAELFLQDRPIKEAYPAYAHLILATGVVTTSWVGWSVSEASKRLRVDKVFSWPFLILLVDVSLVIFYFILARGAEVPKTRQEAVVPSAWNETVAVMCVFLLYLCWDFLTKAVVPDPAAAPQPFVTRFEKTFWARGWISALCAFLGVLAFLFLRNASSPVGVVLVDVTLLLLVLSFRALKEKAHPLCCYFFVLMTVLVGIYCKIFLVFPA